MKEAHPFYVWLLPLIWAVGTTAQHQYPGDEYGFYALSALPAFWCAPFILLAHVPMETTVPWVVLAGAPLVILAGRLLDFLRVSKPLWAVLFLVCAVIVSLLAVGSYPRVERAIAANGPLWAYGLLGANVGLHLSVRVSVVVTVVAKAVRRSRAIAVARREPEPGCSHLGNRL